MPTEIPWLEYRLESLEFQNGAVLGFNGARMWYRYDDNKEIAIDRLKMPPAAVDAMFATVRNGARDLPEIKTINYEMRVQGYVPQAFFYHPMKRGVGVRLEPRLKGQNMLYFSQKDGRPIFSKDWTLRQVTNGQIPIDRAVWQFHGYQHEH